MDERRIDAPPAALLCQLEGVAVLPASIRRASGSKMAGRACTVLTAPDDNLWLHRALERARAGDVLVVATGAAAEFGLWGALLTEAALQRRLAGLVIEGCVRDVEDIMASGFPVWALGTALRSAGKRAGAEGGVDIPIAIGGAGIRPGDMVVGDADGVVVIPGHDVTRTLERAEALRAVEDAALQAIRAGTLPLVALAEARAAHPDST